MNCEEVNELLGAWALDALPEDEARLVEEHMATCNRHVTEARELRLTGLQLAAGAESVAPPPGLRARVLSAVDATADEDAVTRRPVRLRGRRASRVQATPRWTAWALGAAAAIIAALAIWNVILQRGGGDDVQRLGQRAQIVTALQPQGATGSGVVLYFPDKRQALVVGDGLGPLDEGRTYQLWDVAGGSIAPASIGLMTPDKHGHGSAVVPYAAGEGHALAMTVEPEGGSPQPTSAPVYVAEL